MYIFTYACFYVSGGAWWLGATPFPYSSELCLQANICINFGIVVVGGVCCLHLNCVHRQIQRFTIL